MSELHPLLRLPLLYVLHKEPECIVPREEDILDDIPHSFPLEAKAFSSHHWRVDEVQSRKRWEEGAGGREGGVEREGGGKERDNTRQHNVRLVSSVIAIVTT